MNGFTREDLGCDRGGRMFSMINRVDAPESKAYLELFDQLWNDQSHLKDVTDKVLESITTAYQENSPEFLYFYALYNIFGSFLEQVNEDDLPSEANGFKESQVWNKLYTFQKDAVIAIISKLEQYNGCILADSVGLGKTFTALAVIKYYENRNLRVLVLCPKKLSDNWMTYKANYVNNPIAGDRLRYDVLYHTDLSRDKGFSGEIDLSKLNWSAYDLVVIDESHNFRNGGDVDNEGKENRYTRLMNKVIRPGARTRVLMLSATPVNNRFYDLRNQLALAYEGDSSEWQGKLDISRSVEEVFRNAQKVFNEWSKLDVASRTTDQLMQMLDFEFFQILDAVTIARSRRHIEKYYDVSEIGKFPTRLPPISKRPPLTDLPGAISYSEIYDDLLSLTLSIYTPTNYILPSKLEKYAKLNHEGKNHLTQAGREQGIRRLMSINLLKRLESSLHSFQLTLGRIEQLIAQTLDTIAHYDPTATLELNDLSGVADLDADDQESDLFTVGRKVKIELADMDYVTWRKDLEEDQHTLRMLDAMDAYNQHLVKKIAALGITLTGTTATNSFVYVEGVDIYKNKAPTARLGFEIKGKTGTRTMVRKVQGGDDLYTLSGELDEYADRFVILPDGIDGRDNSVTFLNGLKLYAGQISGNEQMTALQRRIQIRETIRTHIQRERELYPRGIKVLSLFFIDEVSKYRLYDGDNDDGRNGEYAKMFEEEYENVVGQMQRQFGDDAYLHYLDGIDVHKTHQGYFSIDKKKGKKARFVEGKIDRKTQLSDDVDAYDLIMKDKERLLSLDEPVRFIFSHSALREGWDNPNVFQICTLKPQSESEIRSRQEIGRGLRLCVNQQGERMDESVLGRDVQELNKLTLITDLEYGKFAEALQTGLAESLADRPQKVDTQLFVGRTLVDANGEQVHVTQDLANAIYEDLIQNDYVKRGKLTDKYFADKEIGSFHVASEVSGYADSVVRILSGVYDAHTMAPENAHSNNVQAIVDEEKLHKAEFLNLWNRINHKSFYTVQFDTPELIDHSIRALDSKLNVTRVQINLEYGEQTARLESREQLEQGKGFQKARSDRESAKYAPLGSVRYDLVGKLVEETGLTRATVAAILRGIAPQTFSQFRINPEEFILKAARLINDEKATQIIEHITYNRLDAAYDQDVFTRATLRGKLDVNAMEANRSLYSHVIYDSDNERRFAQELDVSDQVAVYVKLPGSFYISTPVGKYNPDWAIAFNEGSVKHIYFVAETKGNLDTMELRGVENAKIECAKKHFAAISNGSVVYSVVDNYSTLMQLVSN